jgi:hypothetical protein
MRKKLYRRKRTFRRRRTCKRRRTSKKKKTFRRRKKIILKQRKLLKKSPRLKSLKNLFRFSLKLMMLRHLSLKARSKLKRYRISPKLAKMTLLIPAGLV